MSCSEWTARTWSPRDNSPVTLRGVGLGGWMNMENFITGYPSTESLQRKALRKALGPEGYERFFDDS